MMLNRIIFNLVLLAALVLGSWFGRWCGAAERATRDAISLRP